MICLTSNCLMRNCQAIACYYGHYTITPSVLFKCVKMAPEFARDETLVHYFPLVVEYSDLPADLSFREQVGKRRKKQFTDILKYSKQWRCSLQKILQFYFFVVFRMLNKKSVLTSFSLFYLLVLLFIPTVKLCSVLFLQGV